MSVGNATDKAEWRRTQGSKYKGAKGDLPPNFTK